MRNEKRTPDKNPALFTLVDILLDPVVPVMLLKAGFGFYASLSVWVAYAILLFVPWRLGRRQQ